MPGMVKPVVFIIRRGKGMFWDKTKAAKFQRHRELSSKKFA